MGSQVERTLEKVEHGSDTSNPGVDEGRSDEELKTSKDQR